MILKLYKWYQIAHSITYLKLRRKALEHGQWFVWLTVNKCHTFHSLFNIDFEQAIYLKEKLRKVCFEDG